MTRTVYRSLITGVALLALGCNPLLGIDPDVTILCETGADCPTGFCGADFQCDDSQWAMRFGGVGADAGTALAYSRHDGTIVVAGSFSQTMTLGGRELISQGDDDIFVAKLDGGGHVLWSRAFGSAGNDGLSTMAIAPNGDIVIAGEYEGQFDIGMERHAFLGNWADHGYFARLDAEGEPLASHGFRVTEGLTVAGVVPYKPQPDGFLLFGAHSGMLFAGDPQILRDETPQNVTHSHAFIFDGSGMADGLELYKGDGDVKLTAVDVDATGNYIVGGSYSGSVFAPLQCANPPPDEVCPVANEEDIFIVQGDLLDGVGLTITRREEGGQRMNAVVLISSDNFGLAYTTESSFGRSIELLLILGTVVSISGNAEQDVPDEGFGVGAMAASGRQEVFTLGYLNGTIIQSSPCENTPLRSSGDRDLMLIVVDEDGKHDCTRTRTFGGVGPATPGGMFVYPDGSVVFAGRFDGELVLDNAQGRRQLVSVGGSDVFLARLRL